ncbi:MAG: nicotinamide mononucleotide transporter [Bacteroidetes bacterium]|nr:nicotinamide mononucleotide transporter [Bacteroidota bacterium]
MSSLISTFFSELLNAFLATGLVEWIAVISGTVYVLLAAFQNPLCWPAGILSSALYIKINFDIGLNLDALLQIYYCGAGLYGWWLWMKKNTPQHQAVQISRMPLKYWKLLVLLCTSVALLLGILQQRYTASPAPFADAALTAASFAATWMTARKYIENWLIWIAADSCYVILYAQRSYPLTSVLFIIYTFTAVTGFLLWRKQIRTSNV